MMGAGAKVGDLGTSEHEAPGGPSERRDTVAREAAGALAAIKRELAAILLVAGAFAASGNPLSALQTASVTSGLPFSVVLALMCWGLTRQFRQDVVPAPAGAAQVGSGARS